MRSVFSECLAEGGNLHGEVAVLLHVPRPAWRIIQAGAVHGEALRGAHEPGLLASALRLRFVGSGERRSAEFDGRLQLEGHRARGDWFDCYRVRSAIGGLGRRGGVRDSIRGTSSRFDRTSHRERHGAGAGRTVGGADGKAAGGAREHRSRGRRRLGRARVGDVATRAEECGVDGRDGGHGDTSDWRVVFSRVSKDDLVKGVDLRVGRCVRRRPNRLLLASPSSDWIRPAIGISDQNSYAFVMRG